MEIVLGNYDPEEWQRRGQGRELQFFATDEEMASYLAELPDEYGPYDIVATEFVPDPERKNRYRSEAFAKPLSAWLSDLSGGRGFETQFWVRGAAIAPMIPWDSGRTVEAWCAVNGCLLVQHGSVRKGRRDASRIAVVSMIENTRTGQVVRLDVQGRIFEGLRKRIRKDLVYATVQVFRDGTTGEDDRVQLMTSAAAELAREREGFFERNPGRCLR